MNFITLAQLAAHAKKHPETVRRALKAARMYPNRTPGVHGLRIKLTDANRFLARQWPAVGEIKEGA